MVHLCTLNLYKFNYVIVAWLKKKLEIYGSYLGAAYTIALINIIMRGFFLFIYELYVITLHYLDGSLYNNQFTEKLANPFHDFN